MNLQSELNKTEGFKNLELLAKQVVEGFISGMHKSPFHGFSAEFAEHKIYNQGESTRHIDWKLFAKTDKLYTKRYDDETNLLLASKKNQIIEPFITVSTSKKLDLIFRESLVLELFWENKIDFKIDGDLEMNSTLKINFKSLIKKYFSKKLRQFLTKLKLK